MGSEKWALLVRIEISHDITGALINGELFLELPDDKEWLEELKLSGAFKRLITNKVKQVSTTHYNQCYFFVSLILTLILILHR